MNSTFNLKQLKIKLIEKKYNEHNTQLYCMKASVKYHRPAHTATVQLLGDHLPSKKAFLVIFPLALSCAGLGQRARHYRKQHQKTNSVTDFLHANYLIF